MDQMVSAWFVLGGFVGGAFVGGFFHWAFARDQASIIAEERLDPDGSIFLSMKDRLLLMTLMQFHEDDYDEQGESDVLPFSWDQYNALQERLKSGGCNAR